MLTTGEESAVRDMVAAVKALANGRPMFEVMSALNIVLADVCRQGLAGVDADERREMIYWAVCAADAAMRVAGITESEEAASRQFRAAKNAARVPN